MRVKTGGESGIRTHVTLSSKHAFQACAFSHSAISPAAIILVSETAARPQFLALSIGRLEAAGKSFSARPSRCAGTLSSLSMHDLTSHKRYIACGRHPAKRRHPS